MSMCWEEPPDPSHRGQGDAWQAEVAELKAHPGQWAVLKEYPSPSRAAYAFASVIKNGKLKAFQGGRFSAACRSADGKVKVYVRYDGPA